MSWHFWFSVHVQAWSFWKTGVGRNCLAYTLFLQVLLMLWARVSLGESAILWGTDVPAVCTNHVQPNTCRVIKFYWNSAMCIHLCIVSGCFHATVTELNSCSTYSMRCWAKVFIILPLSKRFQTLSPEQWFSKYGPWTRSICTTWNLVKKCKYSPSIYSIRNSRVGPATCDSDSCQSLRTTEHGIIPYTF